MDKHCRCVWPNNNGGLWCNKYRIEVPDSTACELCIREKLKALSPTGSGALSTAGEPGGRTPCAMTLQITTNKTMKPKKQLCTSDQLPAHLPYLYWCGRVLKEEV